MSFIVSGLLIKTNKALLKSSVQLSESFMQIRYNDLNFDLRWCIQDCMGVLKGTARDTNHLYHWKHICSTLAHYEYKLAKTQVVGMHWIYYLFDHALWLGK